MLYEVITTYPYHEISNKSANIEHEATTSKISEEQLFYLNQRGIKEEDAIAMIVNGFCNVITSYSIHYTKLYEETQITKSTYDNNIRTLILSGELDPITTVSYAQYIHNKLKNSTMVTFRNIAHNIERTICGKQTIQKFLDDTNNFTPPECVNDENKIDFYIPENL